MILKSNMVVLVIFTSLVGLSLGCVDRPKEELRNIFESKYTPPFRLIQVSDWRDGGSTGFELIDSSGKSLRFCECRIGGGSSSGNVWSKHLGRVYFGAMHPTHKDAKLVETVVSERALLEILQKTVDLERLELLGNSRRSKEEFNKRKYELEAATRFLKRRGY